MDACGSEGDGDITLSREFSYDMTKEEYVNGWVSLTDEVYSRDEVPGGLNLREWCKSEAGALAPRFWEGVHDNVAGGFSAPCVMFNGTVYRGDTYEELVKNVKDSLGVMTIDIQFGLYKDMDSVEYGYSVKIEKTTEAGCAFFFEPASENGNAISWLCSGAMFIVGMQSEEWMIAPGASAQSVSAKKVSAMGGEGIRPVLAGSDVFFVQGGKKSLRRFSIPAQEENYRASGADVFNPEIVAPGITQLDYTSGPVCKLYAVLSDGTMAVLLLENGLLSWQRFRLAKEAGLIKSVVVVFAAGGGDAVYLGVAMDDGSNPRLLKVQDGLYVDDATSDAGANGKNYTSVFRSMPIVGENPFAVKRITSLALRLLESSLPKLKSVADNRDVTITHVSAPFTGIVKVPFPCGYDREVMFELVDDGASECKVLAIDAEMA